MSIHVGILASEVANNTTMFYSIMRAFITKREPEIDTQVPVSLTFLIPGVLLRKDFAFYMSYSNFVLGFAIGHWCKPLYQSGFSCNACFYISLFE